MVVGILHAQRALCNLRCFPALHVHQATASATMDHKSVEALIRHVSDAPLLPEQYCYGLCRWRSSQPACSRLAGYPLHRNIDVLMLCYHHKTHLVCAGKQMDYRIELEQYGKQ